MVCAHCAVHPLIYSLFSRLWAIALCAHFLKLILTYFILFITSFTDYHSDAYILSHVHCDGLWQFFLTSVIDWQFVW